MWYVRKEIGSKIIGKSTRQHSFSPHLSIQEYLSEIYLKLANSALDLRGRKQ